MAKYAGGALYGIGSVFIDTNNDGKNIYINNTAELYGGTVASQAIRHTLKLYDDINTEIDSALDSQLIDEKVIYDSEQQLNDKVSLNIRPAINQNTVLVFILIDYYNNIVKTIDGSNR